MKPISSESLLSMRGILLTNGWHLLVCALGLSILAIALAAPKIGLGLTTDFVLYRWLGLSRTATVFAGAFVAAASLLVSYARLRLMARLCRDATRSLMLSLSIELVPSGIRHPADFMLFASQFVFVSAVALVLLFVNRSNLLGYIDGQYLLTLMQNQRLFAPPWPVFSANPLQGLGDVWYFVNTKWIPEFLIGSAFGNISARVVAIHYVALAEVFLATSLLCYWTFRNVAKAVAAGWLAILIIFPLTYPSLIYNISPDGPQVAFLTVTAIALIPLFDILGHPSLWRNALAGVLVFILLWLQFIGVGLFSALTYPFIAIAALTNLAAQWRDRPYFLRKLISFTAIFALLCISGLPLIILSFTLDTAFHMFPAELARPAYGLSLGSMLFRSAEPVGMWLAIFGLLGSGVAAFFGRGRVRQLGSAVLITAALILTAAVVYAGYGWSGAVPLYYEYVLWPLYPIFAVLILSAFARSLSALFFESRLFTLIRSAYWLVLPLLALLVLHGPNFLRHNDLDRPNVYPPRPSEITHYLSETIGLAPGQRFNGRVATFTGERANTGTTWVDAFGFDLTLVQAVGNDHRTIGLWSFDIPTLVEFSHTIRPLFYYVVSRHLADEKDGQQRNIVNLRRPNVQILRLLGVRYLVRDTFQPDQGMKRVVTMPVPSANVTLSVDEIPNPNIAVSPTRVVMQSPAESMERIADPSFDFENVVLLREPVEVPLAQASNLQVSVERNGVRVRASSPGTSLIVIPLQFSHCLQAVPAGETSAPLVLRANGLLTGLRFDGRLDAIIEYRRGPFIRMACGLTDVRDDQAILRDAR